MVQIHLRLPDDVVIMIDNLMEGANTTDKVKNFICSNVIGREMLLLERERCNSKLKYIKDALDKNPFYRENILSKEENQFLTDTLDALNRSPDFKKSPSFFSGRSKIYNHQFAQSITSKEFELLLYRFKENKK